MTVHPKVLERADNILSLDEEVALKLIKEISNTTVLNVMYTQEISGQKRQPIVEFLQNKLDIQEGGDVGEKVVETLANQYLGNITESEEETFVFETSNLRDEKEEEEEVDSSTDSSKLS